MLVSLIAFSSRLISDHQPLTSTIEPFWASITAGEVLSSSETIESLIQDYSTIEYLPVKTITAVPTIPFAIMSPKPESTLEKPTDEPTLEPAITYAPSPTTGPVQLDPWCIPINAKSTKAQVKAIIDGVTIEAIVNGRTETIRYIGIGLPDYSENVDIWNGAFQKNQELVEGKTIWLIKDQSEEEIEGMLQRYVLAGSIFVNRELVESGYTIADSTPPDTSCDGILEEAEKSALANHSGLWAFTPTPSRTFPTATFTPSRAGDVIIVKISPTGTAWQEPEEFVEILNDGDAPVQLEHWTLRDIENHTFVFPKFVLGPGQYCRIYTNQYQPDHCGLSYYSLSPIWENNKDCAYLQDGDGVLIDTFCYE